MNQQLLAYIRKEGKFPFQWSDIWNRYFIFLLPLYLLLMAVLFTLDEISKSNVFPQEDRQWILIGFWGTGILSALYIFRRLAAERKFYQITEKASGEQVLATLKELGWKVVSKGSTFFVAHVELSWTSWGDAVTIVMNKDEIFFNARPLAQPFTFNREKVLRKRFESALKELSNG